MSKSHDLDAIRQDCQAFPSRFSTVHLATVGSDGMPEASYAPFVQIDGRYYIYLSELARHTQNLLASADCCALFIESEADCANYFARKRLTLKCKAKECARESKVFEEVLDQFTDEFGNFVDVIRNLKDFHLFELSPQSGSFVAGFAKAYTLDGDDLGNIRHRVEKGHQSQDGESSMVLQNIQMPTAS